MQKKLSTLLSTSILLVGLSGCVVGNQMGHSGNDVYSTFGDIGVIDGERAGDLENNSGNITIGRNAKVKAVDITNGNIDIGEHSEAYSLKTTNGNIDVGKNVVITRSVETVNGQINIQQGAKIGANLMASNGDVSLAKNSLVQGDVIFGDTFLSSQADKMSSLSIAEGATIEGQIHLYKKVIVVLPDSINPDKIVKHYQDKK
ncbi:hypothetical protein [Paraglaciecola sp.]|uniref:hypothetical protein n=1 Tax=Paraglaciecola sp. TaxID=1920173 RepID=UPI0030F45C6E